MKRGDKTKELSGITVLLQDLKGNIIKQVKTSYDGFYLFYNIKPGKYHISFLKDQLSQLNAHFGQSEVLEITKAGDIHNEQNIELILSL